MSFPAPSISAGMGPAGLNVIRGVSSISDNKIPAPIHGMLIVTSNLPAVDSSWIFWRSNIYEILRMEYLGVYLILYRCDTIFFHHIHQFLINKLVQLQVEHPLSAFLHVDLAHISHNFVKTVGNQNFRVVWMNYLAGTEEDSSDMMSLLQQSFNHGKELDKMTLGSNIVDK